MGLLDFNRQCPFTQDVPLAITGIPGIIYVLILPFLLSIGEDRGREVFTISHTARQPYLAFSFAQFFILQILFMCFCMADGVLIALYIIAFANLAVVFLCNPKPSDKSTCAAIGRKVHSGSAFLFFSYMLVIAFMISVVELKSFDGFTGVTPTEATLRALGLLLVFLQLGAYIGMIVLLWIHAADKEPDLTWPRTWSHLERLYALFFFIMLILIPNGTLVG